MFVIQVLFYVSCAFAIIAFCLFVLLVCERLLTIRDLRKRIAKQPVTAEELKGFEAKLQSGGLLDAPDKLLEAMAKLTDSLAKAPLPVVVLIASVLFLLIAAGTATLECKCFKAPEQPKVKESRLGIDTPHCMVGTFVEGQHIFDGPVKDSPQGCFAKIRGRLQGESPPILMIIGHVDLRELKHDSRRTYASNLSLAYQRARAIRTMLVESGGVKPGDSKYLPSLASQMVLLAVGANNIRESKIGEIGSDLLAADRVAEIVALSEIPRNDSKP